ncbi:biotin-dependent carboxyltransferase family protein [Paenibacillus sp. NEAU-GSW1]|uniref:5-oxoprolinase subunit C family protein n=1 Tax=Paenibacillus sp. NEAU-GSW1 TaxID=2682486 RepID=UPI0012E27F19|nr:biotin-dependent carboxyltransferase family protein [Paenibacillus sp. NEAU-GSW1]MUT67126.1 allophanate hydrolase subunit 2 family protein [Paenibacillus sp. NEAU-GSW1]
MTTSEGNNGFLLKNGGLLTTVQHLGTSGLRAYGVSGGGAMDRESLRIANWLTGNSEDEAGLELTLAGPELVLETDMLVAITGAPMSPSVDGEALPMWRPVWVRQGAAIRFGRAARGCRTYVAAAGGLAGGRGKAGRLRAGDFVRLRERGEAAPSRWAAEWAAVLAREAGGRNWSAARWFAPPPRSSSCYGGGAPQAVIGLRTMTGSEFGQFSEAARTAFFRERYRVAPASDRMGCRLEGAPLERLSRAELLSHGVTPGAVQVPPGGLPIVLGADCQTTGGYPKIAHVATVDLPLLGQLKPGDWLSFQHVALEEAQRLDLESEYEMSMLKAAIRSRRP